MIPLSLKLKALLPGYRAKWRRHFSAMLEHMETLAARARFGAEQETPFVDDGDVRFYGFWSGPKDYAQMYAVGNALPGGLKPEFFRLAKDYVTRYLFPHLRPDLWPEGLRADNCGGFHGQHKETLADYAGADQAFLARVFAPKADEVIIDCGCFIGMGDTHMAREMGNAGRIVAIEADRDCHALLCRNVEANGLSGTVVPLHRGAWNRESVIQLQSSHAQANTLVAELHTGDETYDVKTVSVDQVVREQGLRRVDMLSMTINGAEVEALQGAVRTLQELRPRVRLAGWYLRDGVPIWQHAKMALEPQGYKVFNTPHGNVLAVPQEVS